MSSTDAGREARGRRTRVEDSGFLHFAGRFGLPVLLLIVLIVFSLWKTESFFSWNNFRAIFSQEAIIAMVAFGVMVPLVVGEFDLSVGANAGLAAILAVGLSGAVNHLGAWPAIVIAVLASTFVGFLNGLIVTRLMVNSFIATLGMATAIEGVGQLYTHSTELQGTNTTLLAIGRHEFFGLPTTVLAAIVVGVALLIVLQYLPVGRQLLAVGANRRAAELTGIRSNRRVLLAFAGSGLIVGIGGALYGANLGAAGNTTGGTLLLPAFAGAFLGSTAILPGRYNVLGTVVAVLLLAFTISGLEQVGVEVWIQSLIQGIALIGAVAFSSWALRQRAARLRDIQLKLLEDDAAVERTETIEATSAKD